MLLDINSKFTINEIKIKYEWSIGNAETLKLNLPDHKYLNQ